MDKEGRYRTTDQWHRRTAVLTSHMLVSLLSLLGEGFEGSLAVFPLDEAAVSVLAATAVTERLDCSSLRASGLGCVGGACSAGGWTVSSCCSLWLCSRRSWTRSSKMASCSSWMAWFRWVFLFYRATKSCLMYKKTCSDSQSKYNLNVEPVQIIPFCFYLATLFKTGAHYLLHVSI